MCMCAIFNKMHVKVSGPYSYTFDMQLIKWVSKIGLTKEVNTLNKGKQILQYLRLSYLSFSFVHHDV